MKCTVLAPIEHDHSDDTMEYWNVLVKLRSTALQKKIAKITNLVVSTVAQLVGYIHLN